MSADNITDGAAEKAFARVDSALEQFERAFETFKKQPIAHVAHDQFVRLNTAIRALPPSLRPSAIDKLLSSIRRGHFMLRDVPPNDLADILSKLKDKWLRVVEAGAENVSLHEMLTAVEEVVRKQREELQAATQTKLLSSQRQTKIIKDGLEVLTGAGFITADLWAASLAPNPATMTSVVAGFTMFWRGIRG